MFRKYAVAAAISAISLSPQQCQQNSLASRILAITEYIRAYNDECHRLARQTGDQRRRLSGAEIGAERRDLPESQDLVATLRRLIDRVVVHAAKHDTRFDIEVHGRLAQLTESPVFPPRSEGG